MVGVDVEEARAEVRRAANRSRPTTTTTSAAPENAAPPRRQLPDLRDPRFAMERETLKLVVQHPMVIGRTTSDVGPEDFMHPTYRAVWELVAAAGGPLAGAADQGWSARLREAAQQRNDPALVSAVSALAVEPLLTDKAPDAAYVVQHVVRLLELTALRRIAAVKSKLQRTNPVEEAETYNRMFGELAALEAHRRALRDRIVGTE
jgi:DNA primase